MQAVAVAIPETDAFSFSAGHSRSRGRLVRRADRSHGLVSALTIDVACARPSLPLVWLRTLNVARRFVACATAICDLKRNIERPARGRVYVIALALLLQLIGWILRVATQKIAVLVCAVHTGNERDGAAEQVS